jgi:hypothetical protein
VICEIMNEDGSMARLPDLVAIAQRHGMKIGTISDLIAYRRRYDNLVRETAVQTVSSEYGGAWQLRVFTDTTVGAEHLVLSKGDLTTDGPVLVRMHAMNPLEDLLALHPGRSHQLRDAMLLIAAERILHVGVFDPNLGGDPLLLSGEKLENLLSRLRAIPHVEFLRIGTRIPIFLPQRITPELCAMLKQFHPLFISVHTNHPRELTTEVRDALGRLADAGIPLGNQSVLLKHVNDDAEVMKVLVQKLLMCRVKPYYIYQCDLIAGSAHLRASVAKGLEILEKLRGHTTGYAVPTYVIDAPGGGGKVPINPEYVLCRNAGRVLIRNFEGKIFEYPETADGRPCGQPKKKIEESELV